MATAHLVVSAIVRRDGAILLVEEIGPGDPAPTWMLPGGVVEVGESVLEALRRELREETGLQLSGEPRLAFVAHVVGPLESHLALTFACDATGSLRPADPDGLILDVAWCEEADALERLGRVDWYDTAPLRRFVADGGPLGGGGGSAVSGTLHLVAVPIGNPDDLSPRARDTLAKVAVVAAEDTRHFATLARHHGIRTRTLSYHDHNEDARGPELLARLLAGEDVALVSDAGTPLISDPGYRLVRAAIDAGVAVTSLPGPSAVTTALAASGLPPHPFRFIGFLPRTAAARRSALEDLAADPATLVAFEAPRRLVATLRDALDVLGDRPACVARNLTKPHERWQRGPLSMLIGALVAEGEVRGESTLVVGGAAGPADASADAEADARLLLANGAPARAVQELLVQRHGLSRRDAYALVLAVKDR